MPVNELDRPKHLLIMRLSAIGDVAMTVPVVLALRQQYPKLKITVVSKPFFKAFFSLVPDINFFEADVENSKNGLMGLYRIYKELSKIGVDAFADLHNVLRSKVISQFFKLNNVPVISLNKDRATRKKLTALQIKEITPMLPLVNRHAIVCRELGLPIDLSKVVLLEKRHLSKDVQQLAGPKKTKWLGIAPFATYKTKMYPLSLMKEIIGSQLKEGCKIFLFGGGKTEEKELESLASISQNCINVAGKLKFDQELELISNLDLMLSMDSGNGHMAAMFGVPVLTMWGNTHPYAGFIPFRQDIENSILPDRQKYPFLPTSVYGNKMVEGYVDCMKTIDPQHVSEKLKTLLAVSKTKNN